MDLNFLREPALLLFASAIMIEAWVVFELFFDKVSLPVPRGLKWVTSTSFVLFSGVNIYAFQEVYTNTALTNPLITKMLYCASGLLVMASMHFVNKWVKEHIAQLEAADA